MKTLRLFGMTLLMVMLAVSFTACSDKDEEASIPIIGTWVYTTGAGNKEVVTFNNNRSGTWESIDIYDNTSDTDPFTFTVDDNKGRLILDFGDNSPETFTYKISDNKMILTYEDGHVEAYTKQ